VYELKTPLPAALVDSRSVAEHSPLMLLTHFVGDAARKRIEADIIAGPSWPLEGRAFAAATQRQFVA